MSVGLAHLQDIVQRMLAAYGANGMSACCIVATLVRALANYRIFSVMEINPTVLAVGPADCGKTAVARIVLALMGDGGLEGPPRLMAIGITEPAVTQLASAQRGLLICLNDVVKMTQADLADVVTKNSDRGQHITKSDGIETAQASLLFISNDHPIKPSLDKFNTACRTRIITIPFLQRQKDDAGYAALLEAVKKYAHMCPRALLKLARDVNVDAIVAMKMQLQLQYPQLSGHNRITKSAAQLVHVLAVIGRLVPGGTAGLPAFVDNVLVPNLMRHSVPVADPLAELLNMVELAVEVAEACLAAGNRKLALLLGSLLRASCPHEDMDFLAIATVFISEKYEAIVEALPAITAEVVMSDCAEKGVDVRKAKPRLLDGSSRQSVLVPEVLVEPALLARLKEFGDLLVTALEERDGAIAASQDAASKLAEAKTQLAAAKAAVQREPEGACSVVVLAAVTEAESVVDDAEAAHTGAAACAAALAKEMKEALSLRKRKCGA